MSPKKCTMFKSSCKLRICLLADTSASHMALSLGRIGPHIVQFFSIALLAVVNMCQGY